MSVLTASPIELVVSGMAVAASEEFTLATLRGDTVAQLKQRIIASTYWSQFVGFVQAGQVAPNWLPGALGRMVFGWAQQGVEAY